MGSSQQRYRYRVRVLLLAALLLVPIALSGHTHLGPGTHPCSLCAVAHHAPIVRTTAPLVFAATFSGLVRTPRTAPARTRTDQAPPTGRAPPSNSRTVVA